MRLERFQRWTHRTMIQPMGFYSEHWNPTTGHPANERFREAGRDPDQTDWHITRGLILNVVHAAGGVEYCAVKLEAALDAEEDALDEVPHLREPQHHPVGYVGLQRDVINYEFANLLFWLKALEDRLRVREPISRYDVGLLPALACGEPWTDEIGALHRALKNSGAFAYREVANFATHAAAAPQPFAGLLIEQGQLVLKIPDEPTRRIYTVEELRYEKGRDARSFARTALAAVEAFMDGMLDAFEGAREEIEERRATAAALDND